MFDEESFDHIGNRSTRSFTEIILKTIAICITTTIAAGHLNSLRCISRKERREAVLSVAYFLLLPTLPLATLVYNIYHAFRSKGGDLSFKLGIVFGMRATPIQSEEGEISIPLNRLEFTNLQRVSKKRDIVWAARMFVLLAFEVQAVSTIVLMIRRFRHTNQQTQESAAAAWDLFNGFVAFGGAITGLISIGILLVNYEWECFQLSHINSERQVEIQLYTPPWMLVIPDSMLSPITLAIWMVTLPFTPKIFVTIKDVFQFSKYSAVMMAFGAIYLPFPFQISKFFSRGTWKYLPALSLLSSLMDRVKAMSICTPILFLIIFTTYNQVTDMKASKAKGLWMEVMWVDPLAEKLYVF